MENNYAENNHSNRKRILKFVIPSLIGVFLFLFPVPQNGAVTIPIGIIIDWIKAVGGNAIPIIIYISIALSFIMTIVTKAFKPAAIMKSPYWKGLFDVGPLQIIIRTLATIFTVIIYFNLPVEIVTSPDTGGTVSGLLKSTLVSIFACCYALPLIMDYGAMDFTGTLCRGVIRPLFRLPGRSAVDLLTSWVGGNSSGILLTIRQYETDYYTAREACIISTMFSVVSIPFCLTIAEMLGVGNMFLPFYGILCLVGIISTFIMVRIPPLRTFNDEYYHGHISNGYAEKAPDGMSKFQWGVQLASKKAESGGNIFDILKSGTEMYGGLLFSLAPNVMTIGVVALILTTYTPIFQWISIPFGYYMDLLGIEEAFAASPACVVGFADMFLPAIVASGISSIKTKFIVGILSLVQIIYLSEMGAVLLGSSIPVKLHHLVILFLEKTVICLPLIVLFANLLF